MTDQAIGKLAYAIDLLFLLIAPLHPALVVLAIVQYAVRRSAWLSAGLLVLAGQTEVTALALVLLPGAAAYLPEEEDVKGVHAIMSSGHGGSVVVPCGPSTGADDAVLPQQNQVEPASVPSFEVVIEFLTGHNLTDEQAIDILALMSRDAGDLLSANKIRDIVGGNEAAVKTRVAAWRPAPEPQRSQGRVPRPDGGW